MGQLRIAERHEPAERRRHEDAEARVLEVVCDLYEIDGAQLTGTSKDPYLVVARRVAVGLMTEAGLSPMEQARLLHRDHSTIYHHQVCLGLKAAPPTRDARQTEASWEERQMLAEGRALLAPAAAAGLGERRRA